MTGVFGGNCEFLCHRSAFVSPLVASLHSAPPLWLLMSKFPALFTQLCLESDFCCCCDFCTAILHSLFVQRVASERFVSCVGAAAKPKATKKVNK